MNKLNNPKFINHITLHVTHTLDVHYYPPANPFTNKQCWIYTLDTEEERACPVTTLGGHNCLFNLTYMNLLRPPLLEV